METNRWSQDGCAALVRDAVAGDEAAWSGLVERFSPLVWAVACAHGLGAVEATGAARVTWLRLAQHLGQIPEPARVGAWLERTARQESLRALALTRLESEESEECSPGLPIPPGSA